MPYRVRLTGAGFTKNYGGFLAHEMWSWLLNSPETESRPFLKLRLKRNFNFESVYSEIWDDEEKQAMTAALRRVYFRQEAFILNEILGALGTLV